MEGSDMQREPARPIRLSAETTGVAWIRMEDSAGRNGLSDEFVDDFQRTFRKAGAMESVRVVVLAGLSDVFCSGATRELLDGLVGGRIPVSELGLPRLLLECPIPVISAMRGSAVGGGLALGLAADIIVMSREGRYGFNFMDLGLTPGMGTTWLARERLGVAIADELMYSTEYRRGSWFASRSLVNHVVPSEAVERLAADVALRIAQKPRGALSLLKAGLTADRLRQFDLAREEEMRMHGERLADPETARLIAENFLA